MTLILRSFAPLALVPLALALAVSAPAWAAPAPYEAVPGGVVVTPTGGQAHRVRLQVVSDRIIRVTASPTDGFDMPASLMSVAQPRADGYQVKAGEGEVDVSTPEVTARVSLASAGTTRHSRLRSMLRMANRTAPQVESFFAISSKVLRPRCPSSWVRNSSRM